MISFFSAGSLKWSNTQVIDVIEWSPQSITSSEKTIVYWTYLKFTNQM